MPQTLPWIALALAVGAVFLRPKAERVSGTQPDATTAGVAIGSALFLALVAWGLAGGLAPDMAVLRTASPAFFLGVAAVRLERLLAERLSTTGSAAWSLGLGAFVVGVAGLVLGENPTTGLLALIAGLNLGLIGSGGASWLGPVALAVLAMDRLGGLSGAPNLDTSGQAAAIAIGIACVFAALGAGMIRDRSESFRPWIGTILTAAAAVLLAESYFQIANGTVVVAVAAGAALVTHFAIRARGEAFGFTLSTLIWLGVATVTFGYLKGFGMALAWSVGLGALLFLGNARAILATGPLASLVVYRLFREYQKDAVRAFDIGQHYAIVGLVLAAGLVLLLLDFGRTAERAKAPVRSLCGLEFGLIGAIGLQVCAFVLLSAKGAVGFLVGTGLASFVAGLRGDRDGSGLATGLGFACLSPVLCSVLVEKLDLARDEKRSFLIVGVACVAVVAVLAMLLTPQKSESSSQ